MKPLLRYLSYCSILTALAVSGFGQTPPASNDAVARQRSAAAAMQDSLSRQRESVQKQMGGTASDSFFLLPRAGSLGGVTAAAAPPPATMPIAPACDPLPADEVESLIGQTADRNGVDAGLLRGVMKQESAFRPCAVSSKGAMGLMQLMPATAEQYGISDPFDAASNLDGGARFLKELLNRYGGDIPKALGAYNAGPSKVDAAGAVPDIPETVDYVRQILAALPIH